MRRSFSLGSYANFEEYFSEEYFRASIIDGTTRAGDSFYHFRICCFFFTKSNACCIFSTRADTRDCVFHLCAGVEEDAQEFSFYLLSGIISKLDQVTEPYDVTHGRVSRNCPPTILARRRLPGIPPDGRHESASTQCRVYFFSLFFSLTTDTSSSALPKRSIIGANKR